MKHVIEYLQTSQPTRGLVHYHHSWSNPCSVHFPILWGKQVSPQGDPGSKGLTKVTKLSSAGAHIQTSWLQGRLPSTTWIGSSPMPTQCLLLFKPQLLQEIISNHHSSHFDIPFHFPFHQSSMKARSVFYTSFLSPNFRNTLDTELLLNRFIIMNFLNETIALLHIKILSIVCPPHQNLEAPRFL